MDSTYSPDATTTPVQPAPNAMPNTPSSEGYQAPSAPVQPAPQAEATPNLSSILRPETDGTEAKPYTKLIQVTQGLLAAAGNDPVIRQATLDAYKSNASEEMKASMEPKTES